MWIHHTDVPFCLAIHHNVIPTRAKQNDDPGSPGILVDLLVLSHEKPPNISEGLTTSLTAINLYSIVLGKTPLFQTVYERQDIYNRL